jgi:hypothetical protein
MYAESVVLRVFVGGYNLRFTWSLRDTWYLRGEKGPGEGGRGSFSDGIRI